FLPAIEGVGRRMDADQPFALADKTLEIRLAALELLALLVRQLAPFWSKTVARGVEHHDRIELAQVRLVKHRRIFAVHGLERAGPFAEHLEGLHTGGNRSVPESQGARIDQDVAWPSGLGRR